MNQNRKLALEIFLKYMINTVAIQISYVDSLRVFGLCICVFGLYSISVLRSRNRTVCKLSRKAQAFKELETLVRELERLTA